jgi:hypothetical protein
MEVRLGGALLDGQYTSFIPLEKDIGLPYDAKGLSIMQ